MDTITCEQMVLSDVYMQNESVKRQKKKTVSKNRQTVKVEEFY